MYPTSLEIIRILNQFSPEIIFLTGRPFNSMANETNTILTQVMNEFPDINYSIVMKSDPNLNDISFKKDTMQILKKNNYFSKKIVFFLDNEAEICNLIQNEVSDVNVFQVLTNQSNDFEFSGLKIRILQHL